MDALEIARCAAGGILGVVGVYISVFNWVVLVRSFTRKAPSWIPVFGGVLMAAAAFIQPSGIVRPWWWLALLVDGGSIPGLLWTLFLLLKRKKEGDE